MTLSGWQIVYVLLAAALMLGWLVLVVIGPRKIDAANVLGVLRYGIALRTLALVLALLPPLVMIYVIWAFPWRSERALHIAGGVDLAASVLSGLLLIEVTRVQVIVTDKGLTLHSPWTRQTSLNWSEVERIGYSMVNRWFTVEGAGRTIRVSRHLAGVGIFADAVRRHVAADRYTGAAAALEAVK